MAYEKVRVCVWIRGESLPVELEGFGLEVKRLRKYPFWHPRCLVLNTYSGPDGMWWLSDLESVAFSLDEDGGAEVNLYLKPGRTYADPSRK